MDSSLPHRISFFLLRLLTGFGFFRKLGDILLGRRINAVAALTIKAAFRYKLVVILMTLLVVAVVGLPSVIKHDGTASGFTQILLTYTLGSMTALLGVATLWMACGTLARDIEDCQIQMLAVKPISRWEIWIGKWIGIVVLNTILLTFAGVTIYSIILWRAGNLSAKEQVILRNQVLVGRGTLKEPVEDIEPDVERYYQLMVKESPDFAKLTPKEGKKMLREKHLADLESVGPNFMRVWTLPLGSLADKLRDKPLRIRMKFHSSRPTPQDIWACVWQVGPLDNPEVKQKRYEMRVQAGSFSEFVIDPNLYGKDGVLRIEYWNYNNVAMLFPLEDGLEVLYPECGFGLNFMRGLAIILLWLGLLAAIGLAAGSYLTFPVAAFASISILMVGLSSSVMDEVIKDGTLYPTNHEKIQETVAKPLDVVMVPLFKVLVRIIKLVEDFSPVDSLSSGRSIYWSQLFMAFTQIGLLMTGFFSATGIILFYRRELATAHMQQ